jgi:hypothetical protein
VGEPPQVLVYLSEPVVVRADEGIQRPPEVWWGRHKERDKPPQASFAQDEGKRRTVGGYEDVRVGKAGMVQ